MKPARPAAALPLLLCLQAALAAAQQQPWRLTLDCAIERLLAVGESDRRPPGPAPLFVYDIASM